MRWLALILAMAVSVCASEFYIATNGNDSASGTSNAPFATLEKARDSIRSVNTGNSNYVVYVEDGSYFRDLTFVLTSLDSAGSGHTITYQNAPGAHPRIIGGRLLSSWSALTNTNVLAQLTTASKTNVVQASIAGLPALLPVARYGYGASGWLGENELYFNNNPMVLARYPNIGWLYVGAIGTQTNVFACTNSNPYTWRTSSSIMAQGYWQYDYANVAELVSLIDSTNHQITLTSLSSQSKPTVGKRYFFLNVLAELDSPGEYYVDRSASKIYFWPPSDINTGEAIFCTSSNIIQCTNVANIVFSGLTFESSTKFLASVNSGHSVWFSGCTFRNTSGKGLYIDNFPNGSWNSGISNSSIYNIGRAAVDITGGNRTTLVGVSNYVVGCVIHDYARFDRTYQPGIKITGVADRVLNNHIFNAPHAAVLYSGNNHTISFNEIDHVVNESSDAGACYDGQDWSQCGNRITFNWFHDIYQTNGATGTEVVGVYCDDGLTGTTIYGNCFNRINYGVEIGGGRNNTVSNNLFIDCMTASILTDQRFTSWEASFLPTLTNNLVAMPYNTPPWSVQYPFLSTLLSDQPAKALHNVFATNVRYGGTWTVWQDGADTVVTSTNNWTSGDPLFVDYPHDNFRLATNSPALALGFVQIPFDQIGPPHFGPLPSPPTNLHISKR